MEQKDIVRLVNDTKIIAIIRGMDQAVCVKLAKAFYEGGIRLVEVTFNQKAPESFGETQAAIRAIRSELGNSMQVGAGTVTSVPLVELASEAGAAFIVSPDKNCDVIRRTKALDMVSMPGAMTPSEVLEAKNAGADFVKLFPAGVLGTAYIKAIRSPINHVPLLAVGGVNEKNAADFIKAGCSGVGVGGNLANREWVAQGAYDRITAVAREFIENLRCE